MTKANFHFFAYAAYGKGISGGDRIFIEFARRWSKKYQVIIYLWGEGYEMCKRQNLGGKNLKFRISSMRPWKDFGFIFNYIARIVESIRIAVGTNLQNDSNTIVYSASEFWMDSLPAFILKIRFSKITWVASWFQTAPSPLKGFAEGERGKKYRLFALFYWLVQLPIKPLMRRWSDFVLVNNESEKKRFPNLTKKDRTIVVIGAVDLEKISFYRKKYEGVGKIYDSVFQGRFHPQKGVIELIDIWKKVVEKIPQVKLAMVGDGPLMDQVKTKIKDLSLERNIKLFGYLFDGEEKYKVFAQSKIVLHPAFYDSGGMASAEAMAFGLPVVGFNLKSYESYYPKGMVKVKTGNLDAFANEVMKLLKDKKRRDRIAKEGLKMLGENWSWNRRAEQVSQRVKI